MPVWRGWVIVIRLSTSFLPAAPSIIYSNNRFELHLPLFPNSFMHLLFRDFCSPIYVYTVHTNQCSTILQNNWELGGLPWGFSPRESRRRTQANHQHQLLVFCLFSSFQPSRHQPTRLSCVSTRGGLHEPSWTFCPVNIFRDDGVVNVHYYYLFDLRHYIDEKIYCLYNHRNS